MQLIKPISVDIEDAVRATGTTRNHIYEAIRTGQLKTALVGKRRLVLYESLEQYINDHKAGIDPAESTRKKSLRAKRTAKAKGTQS